MRSRRCATLAVAALSLVAKLPLPHRNGEDGGSTHRPASVESVDLESSLESSVA
jgi:hypothetical protein